MYTCGELCPAWDLCRSVYVAIVSSEAKKQYLVQIKLTIVVYELFIITINIILTTAYDLTMLTLSLCGICLQI